MNPELSASPLYFLQEDIYLLPEDRDNYLQRPQLPPAVEETPAPEFKYMGDYKKKVLIISHYPEQDVMDATHLSALESTLKRIGLAVDDVAILNIAAHPGLNYDLLTTQLNPDKLIILGIEALPDAMPAVTINQVQEVNGKPILYTFSFGEMMGNKENTKQFWNQVKEF